MVHRIADVALPSKYGSFRAIGYENDLDDLCHVAVIKGDVAGKKNVLVRVHSECLTGMPWAPCAVIAATSWVRLCA